MESMCDHDINSTTWNLSISDVVTSAPCNLQKNGCGPETKIGGFFSLIRHDMIMLGFRKDEVVTHGILMRTQLSGSHDKIR